MRLRRAVRHRPATTSGHWKRRCRRGVVFGLVRLRNVTTIVIGIGYREARCCWHFFVHFDPGASQRHEIIGKGQLSKRGATTNASGKWVNPVPMRTLVRDLQLRRKPCRTAIVVTVSGMSMDRNVDGQKGLTSIKESVRWSWRRVVRR
jgi:hypothetical protein